MVELVRIINERLMEDVSMEGMGGWRVGFVNGGMDGRMDEWIDEWTDG